MNREEKRREVVRAARQVREAFWSDADLLCELAEHAVESTADVLVTRLARLGSWCRARERAAKQAREASA